MAAFRTLTFCCDSSDDLITSTSKVVNEFSVSDGKKLICSIWMWFLCPFKNVCFHSSLSEVDNNNIKTFMTVKSRRRKGEIFYMDSNCKFQSSFHIRRKWAERLFHYGFTANLLVCVCLWNAKFVFQIFSSHDLVNQFLPFALILPNNISFYGDLILQHTQKWSIEAKQHL